MADNNKKCLLCGKGFKFCPTCQQKSPADAWKNIFDKENCRTIFNLACDFHQKEVDIDKAREILLNCDLSDKDTFRSDVVEVIDEILGSTNQTKETNEKEVELEKVEDKIVYKNDSQKRNRKSNRK